tara:strand:+ start:124 stop:645 length:522 start_codon:yes stop_codon:yes gene_type:complete
MNCTECDKKIDDYRYHLGYTECVECSNTEKYSAHVVYPHKTGAYVQPVSKTASNNLKRIDRRSTGNSRTAKGIYVDNSWDRYLESLENPKPKKVSTYVPPKVTHNFRSYRGMKKSIIKYYDKVGYEPAMKQIKKVFSNNKISMETMNQLQNDINNLQMLPARIRRRVLRNLHM